MKLLTYVDAAAYCRDILGMGRVTERSIRTEVEAGSLPVLKFGRSRYVRQADLDALGEKATAWRQSSGCTALTKSTEPSGRRDAPPTSGTLFGSGHEHNPGGLTDNPITMTCDECGKEFEATADYLVTYITKPRAEVA